jgi:hypothetical protein
MSVSDDQVRLNILELLHKHLRDHPNGSGVDRAIIQDALKISEKQMDLNTSYLEDKTLVTLFRTTSSQWTFAKITAEGIDVIENKERYVDKFPFTQTSTSQMNEGSQESDFQEPVQSQVSFTQQVTDAFTQAYDQVRATKLSTDNKGKIEKQLKALEKELLKTKKADLNTIQKSWEWLKKNASSLSPAIAQVVLEGIKIALDLP